MKGKLYLRGSFQTNGTGAIVPFHYHEIDIGEVYTKKEYPFCILLDITISVFSFQKIANIPIRVKRNIIASVFFNSHNNIEIEKKIYTLHDINGSMIQTNIEEKNGKIFLKFAGPFSVKCFYSAKVSYDITTTSNSFYEKPFLINTFVSHTEAMPPELGSGGGGVTVHNDLTGRSDPGTHPASSITNTPYGSITSTNVQNAINELADEIAAIPTPITVHNDLTGRNAPKTHPAASIEHDDSVADLGVTDVQAAINKLDSELDYIIPIAETERLMSLEAKERSGFARADFSSLSYNSSTRQITLNVTSPFNVYVMGEPFKISTSITSSAHPNTTGVYFFYFDSTGTPQFSSSHWDIMTTAPIAFVYYNATLNYGILFDERHGISMSSSTHKYLHFKEGAGIRYGFDISGYVLYSSNNNDKKYQLSSGLFYDEDYDIVHTQPISPTGYSVFYRTGASGEWTWKAEQNFPFLYGANPYYNYYNGTSWVLQPITTNNTWWNIYVVVTNSVDSKFKTFNLIGQQTYTTLSSALAESILNFNFGNIPFQEIAPIYMLTYRRGAYGTPNCRLEGVTKIIGTRLSLSGLVSSNHNSLTGRDVLGSHPASAISYNPNVATGDIFSIDVQNAIQELGAVSGREARTGTITRNINDEITQVLINHSIAGYTTTTNITRNINGDITTIEKIYSNGTDTKTRTISITRDINNKITGWTVT